MWCGTASSFFWFFTVIFNIQFRYFKITKVETSCSWIDQSWSSSKASFWINGSLVSYGADFVCTILHKHLSSIKATIPPEKWPHTLFLQVNNCWKENKNTTVFRYLGLLVKFGWFKQVYMHSLPTGHTHEDIDQMFSTWKLSTRNLCFLHTFLFPLLLNGLIQIWTKDLSFI